MFENINEEIFKNISLLETHFKNQSNCKSINLEFQDQIEKELSNIEKHIEYVEMTDCFITCLEVNKVLKKIKVGKSSGPDKILNEIHKSGDKSNLNNYRGISLMNCLSKIFSVIINARLTNFMDNK